MKKASLTLFAALAAASALTTAPALAQPYGQPPGPGPGYDRDHQGGWDHDHAGGGDRDHGGGWDIDRRIDWTQDRINRERADGDLHGHALRRVQSELNGVRVHEHQIRERTGGRLNDDARAQLQAHLDTVNDDINRFAHREEHHPW